MQDQFFGFEDRQGNVLDAQANIAFGIRHLPEMGSTTAKMVMMERYDSFFGIESHDDARHPLSLIKLHDAENTWRTHPLFEAGRRYHRLRIKDLFQLSLVEFTELPHHVVEILVSLAEELNESHANDNRDLLNQLEGKR